MNDPIPSSKVTASGVAGALITLALFASSALGHEVELSTDLMAGVMTVLTFLVGYATWERRGTNPPPSE